MNLELAALRRFEDLIRARGGLNMRQQEEPVLRQLLRERTHKLQLSHAGAYLDLLESDSSASQSEWRQLWVLLTNQESYFFRDAGQLNVVTNHLLPELMERKRESRTLRIWSAGCSTGEEPYSLAMMLSELPEVRDWSISILATDISEAALQRARRGIYGSWSFRALDERRQERFFRPHGKEWEVVPQLRQNVTWASNNLFGDTFPSRQSAIYDMDLIICRNVFIYFGREAVASVLKKFSATLRPGGFLVCGHAELHDVSLGDFTPRVFPQSVVYQRQIAPQRAPCAPRRVQPEFVPVTAATKLQLPSQRAPSVAVSATSVFPKSVSPVISSKATKNDSQLLEQAEALIRQGHYATALATLQAVLEREPGNVRAMCLIAQAQANSGQLEEAQSVCQRALSIAPFAVLPYHLQARIAEERGDSEGAKSLFKKVLYLNPGSIWAPLELGEIYGRQGDSARAGQLRRAALTALENFDDDEQVPAEEHAVEAPLTVGELRRQLKAELMR